MTDYVFEVMKQFPGSFVNSGYDMKLLERKVNE